MAESEDRRAHGAFERAGRQDFLADYAERLPAKIEGEDGELPKSIFAFNERRRSLLSIIPIKGWFSGSTWKRQVENVRELARAKT